MREKIFQFPKRARSQRVIEAFRSARAFLSERPGLQRGLVSLVIIVILYYVVTAVVAYVTAPRIEMTMSPIAGRAAVSVASAKVGEIASQVTYTGSVIPYYEVLISPRAEGWMQHIFVDVGAKVRKGQLLVRLDKAELQARKEEVTASKIAAQGELEALRAQRVLWEKEFERDRQLYEGDAISASAFDRTRAQYEASKATEEAQLAKIKALQAKEAAQAEVLNYTDIISPITGEVVDRIKLINPGELVKPGEVLLKVADVHQMRIQVNVAERDMPWVKIGTLAVVHFPALPAPHDTGQAKVTAIFPELDPITRTSRMEILVDNSARLIRADMYVVVDLILRKEKNAVIIPRRAVIEVEGKPTVFVTDGVVAKAQPVKLGVVEGDRIQILEGVKEGDMVIVEGNRGLTDGQQINVVSGP